MGSTRESFAGHQPVGRYYRTEEFQPDSGIFSTAVYFALRKQGHGTKWGRGAHVVTLPNFPRELHDSARPRSVVRLVVK